MSCWGTSSSEASAWDMPAKSLWVFGCWHTRGTRTREQFKAYVRKHVTQAFLAEHHINLWNGDEFCKRMRLWKKARDLVQALNAHREGDFEPLRVSENAILEPWEISSATCREESSDIELAHQKCNEKVKAWHPPSNVKLPQTFKYNEVVKGIVHDQGHNGGACYAHSAASSIRGVYVHQRRKQNPKFNFSELSMWQIHECMEQGKGMHNPACAMEYAGWGKHSADPNHPPTMFLHTQGFPWAQIQRQQL